MDSKESEVSTPDVFLTTIQWASSPLNLSRSSTFEAAKAPEAYLGSSEEVGDVQRNLQRNILRDPIVVGGVVNKCVRVLSTVARFVHHACQKPNEQWRNCSASAKPGVSGDAAFWGRFCTDK